MWQRGPGPLPPGCLERNRRHGKPDVPRVVTMRPLAATMLGALLATACLSSPTRTVTTVSGLEPPAFLAGPIERTRYRGDSDDLLSAGLGAQGLESSSAPLPRDPVTVQPAELRRLAIYSSFRALVDVSSSGGFGRLYARSALSRSWPGYEYRGLARTASDADFVTLLVQVPDGFNYQRACIVTAPSSGSRGIHGAIGTTAPWAFSRGCVVAYTDKGTGTGAWELSRRIGWSADFSRCTDCSAGAAAFSAPADQAHRVFGARWPHRFAFRHAHSMRNPESTWGREVLRAIAFALHVLNRDRQLLGGPDSPRLDADNTLVIAAGVSNGGGAVLRAAEQDFHGWIDGVVASEPNVLPAADPPAIRSGDTEWRDVGRSLLDYATLHGVWQPCAVLALDRAATPALNAAGLDHDASARRCRGLRELGLVATDDPVLQAQEALAQLRSAGILEQADSLAIANVQAGLWPAISATYANAYGRFSAAEHLCNVSFAARGASGQVMPLDERALAALPALSSGIPPTAGVQLIHDRLPGDIEADSDESLRAALCWRNLLASQPVAADPAHVDHAARQRVQAGIEEVRSTAAPPVPIIIIHGRADALIPVNHNSRAYVGLDLMQRGPDSQLRYYEIEHGQHFDAWLGLPEFAAHFVPMQVYFERALDLMFSHLTAGAELPASHVVRTRPRGRRAGIVPELDGLHVPGLQDYAERDLIRMDGDTLLIPD